MHIDQQSPCESLNAFLRCCQLHIKRSMAFNIFTISYNVPYIYMWYCLEWMISVATIIIPTVLLASNASCVQSTCTCRLQSKIYLNRVKVFPICYTLSLPIILSSHAIHQIRAHKHAHVICIMADKSLYLRYRNTWKYMRSIFANKTKTYFSIVAEGRF